MSPPSPRCCSGCTCSDVSTYWSSTTRPKSCTYVSAARPRPCRRCGTVSSNNKGLRMLTVHHLGVSQSERIVWLCEELAIPYQLVNYERDPVTRLAPANYKALHPFQTAPVIVDGPVVLSESGAIIE